VDPVATPPSTPSPAWPMALVPQIEVMTQGPGEFRSASFMGVAKFPGRPNFGRSSFLQMSKSPKTLPQAEFLPSIHGGCESAEKWG